MKIVLPVLALLSVPQLSMAYDENGIVGDDDRVVINHPDSDKRTKNLMVGALTIFGGDVQQPRKCSGTLIGEDKVLTSAHCFYIGDKGTVRAGVTYFELQASGAHKPYRAIKATRLFLPQDFVYNADSSLDSGKITKEQIGHDFALITLAEDIGTDVGYHGVKYDTDEYKVDVAVAGYPGDKEGEMAFENCGAEENIWHDDVYDITCDVQKGTSGAGLLARDGEVRGVVSVAAKYTNKAIKFTKPTFNLLKSWYIGAPDMSKTWVYEFDTRNNYTLEFKNLCDRRIHVSYRVEKSSGFEIDGPYILEEGESIWANNIVNKEYYAYAKAGGGQWDGDYEFYVDGLGWKPFFKRNIKADDYVAHHVQKFSCS